MAAAAMVTVTTMMVVVSSPSMTIIVPEHRTWNRNRDWCEETACRADGNEAQEYRCDHVSNRARQ
jgi:hypothetical protein